MNERIQVSCVDCGKEYSVSRNAFRKHKRNGSDFRCLSCVNRRSWANMSEDKKLSRSKKLSDSKKELWNNSSEEAKREKARSLIAGHKKWWDSMSDEDKNNFGKESSMHMKEYRKNMSEEEKIRLSKLMSISQKKRWENMSESDKEEHAKRMSLINKQRWANMDGDERNRMLEILHDARTEAWQNMSDNDREILSNQMRQRWNDLTDDEKNKRLSHLQECHKKWRESLTEEDLIKIAIQGGINSKIRWDNMNDEDRARFSQQISKATKAFWDNLSDEDRKTISENASIRRKRVWKRMSDEDKKYHMELMKRGAEKWRDNLSDEEKEIIHNKQKEWWIKLPEEAKQAYADNHREHWNSLDPSLKEEYTLKKIKAASNNNVNGFQQRFEEKFEKSGLSINFKIVSEHPSSNNSVTHLWDYAIYNQNDKLECIIDLDGKYYHADECDYNGMQAKEEYDERRGLSLPDGVKCYIIYEKELEKSFAYLCKIITLSYDEFVNKMFKEYRMMPFPYPEYTNREMYKSYNSLVSMKCNDKYHKSLSLNTRNGDRLVFNFHKSIFHARIGIHASPHDIWKNDEQLRDMIYNHEFIHTYINKNKILQGFNLKYRVRFMSAGRAKMIIDRYLLHYDEIFDPFSEFSGRMLGTISLGKKYIGQDISEIHVRESNKILDWLRENMYEFDARVTCADSSKTAGKYQCLFTSVPRIGESYEDVDETTLTCDEWIDICLKNYQCNEYAFVVDETEKYIDNIVDKINDELLIIIEGSL